MNGSGVAGRSRHLRILRAGTRCLGLALLLMASLLLFSVSVIGRGEEASYYGKYWDLQVVREPPTVDLSLTFEELVTLRWEFRLLGFKLVIANNTDSLLSVDWERTMFASPGGQSLLAVHIPSLWKRIPKGTQPQSPTPVAAHSQTTEYVSMAYPGTLTSLFSSDTAFEPLNDGDRWRLILAWKDDHGDYSGVWETELTAGKEVEEFIARHKMLMTGVVALLSGALTFLVMAALGVIKL